MKHFGEQLIQQRHRKELRPADGRETAKPKQWLGTEQAQSPKAQRDSENRRKKGERPLTKNANLLEAVVSLNASTTPRKVARRGRPELQLKYSQNLTRKKSRF